MNTLKQYVSTHLFSRKELRTFLALALPMVVSQATDTIMFFTDRLFLSHYKIQQGEIYLNASIIGGVTSFFLMSLFILTGSYTTALTAQYLGAKKPNYCAQVSIQSVYFGLFAYPFMLLAVFFIPHIYNLFDHDPVQMTLQITYSRILLFWSIVAIIRSGISGFFIGIGQSRTVMYSNLIGLILNIPLNYMLIFGVWIFPEMGIRGAAIATVFSACCSLTIQLFTYFGHAINKSYHTRTQLAFNPAIFKKLIKYGIPQGIEGVFGIGAFNYFILVMSNYGVIVGSAVTIAINWDSMFFIPMIGAQFATVSLVGKYMGAKDIPSAIRVARTALSIMMLYAIVIIILFLSFTPMFIAPFMSTMEHADQVFPLAMLMIRTACIYLFADAAHLAFSGVLRGAGDTKAAMYIFMSITFVFSILIYVLIHSQRVSPMGAWVVFIGFALAIGIGMFLRYLQAKWKHIDVIAH